jgi:uncharacterized membrane protein
MEHTNQQSSLDPKGIAMPEPNQSGLSDNAAGAIAYITIVPAIVFLVLEPYNKSAFIRFHAWQSIFFSIVAFVVYVALKMFFMVGLFFAHLACLFPRVDSLRDPGGERQVLQAADPRCPGRKAGRPVTGARALFFLVASNNQRSAAGFLLDKHEHTGVFLSRLRTLSLAHSFFRVLWFAESGQGVK